MKPSRSEFVQLNSVRYHVRLWGEASHPTLFLLHGWMDVGASFQFLVDALRRNWRVIAPDWRGFGQSQWAAHGYYFQDYLADLDALLFHYEPQRPVHLIGHSMGGNVANLYAGARPERIATLSLLEGFGLKPTVPEQAPRRFAKWFDQLRQPSGFKTYGDFAELAARLQANNKRLPDDKALFLAHHWGKPAGDRVELASDPRHKIVNPVLYRLDEAKACWRAITAPVLWVRGTDSTVIGMQTTDLADYEERKTYFASLREVVIADCGHMMHHDQPERLAAILEDFIPA